MKRIVLAALGSMALAACQGEEAAEEAPAAEETAAAAWGGTYETTNAEGESATWVFADDGTFTVTWADGTTGGGTYTSEEGSTCLDPTEAEGEEDTGSTCYAQSEPGEDGSWTSTGPDGNVVTVRAVEQAG